MAKPELSAEAAIRRWFAAALAAVDPERAVRTHLARDGMAIVVDGRSIPVRGRLFVAAVGKAALPMARGAVAACGGLVDGGVIVTKDGHLDGMVPSGFEAYETGHPVPDARCQAAGERLLERLRQLRAGDAVLALISGGASALLEAPVDGVTLAAIAATTDLLLRAGAPIQDLNAVRVPLSKVKGGGLRAAAPSATFATLLLSDVLGNDPRVIASGPTVPTTFTAAGATDLLDRYGLLDRVPASVRAALVEERGAPAATAFAGDVVTVVGDNDAAVRAFAVAADVDGIASKVVIEAGTGEARELAVDFVGRALTAEVPLVLGGGEATVTVRGDGVGGRNTEFALAAALELERRERVGWIVASLATDGQDAMTGVAGAIAGVATLARARAAGIDPERALQANDSLAVFRAAGGAVETGPTATNVNDLYVALRPGRSPLL